MKKTNPSADSIETLLKDGLAAYGRGEISVAMGHWINVIRLDPDNERAKDYIQTAAPELQADVIQLDEHRPADGTSFQEHIQTLLAEKRFHEALVVLRRAKRVQPDKHDVIEAQIGNVKAEIVQIRSSSLGSLAQIPVMNVRRESLERHPFSATEREVVESIDGETSLEGLVRNSRHERHFILTTLNRCLAANIIRLRPKTTSLDTADIMFEALELAFSLERERTENARKTPTPAPMAAPPPPNVDEQFEAKYRSATVAYMSGDLETALSSYRECLELHPDDSRVRHNISRLTHKKT